MRRNLLLGVAVLVAMTVGRVVTDKVPLREVADAPFVRTGVVGTPVHLSYADVTVTGLRGAKQLEGAQVAVPGGRFLVVETTLKARREATLIAGVWLVGRDGTRYVSTNRGSGCVTSTSAPAGVNWYAVWCFDVPESALRGAKVVVSRSDYGSAGADIRRDDVAQVDLGIDAARASEIADTDEAYRPSYPGFAPSEASS